MKNNKRIEQILLSDKMQETGSFQEVIRSDIYNVISDYFDVIDKTLSINIDVDNYSVYSINISCKAEKLKRAYIVK